MPTERTDVFVEATAWTYCPACSTRIQATVALDDLTYESAFDRVGGTLVALGAEIGSHLNLPHEHDLRNPDHARGAAPGKPLKIS